MVYDFINFSQPEGTTVAPDRCYSIDAIKSNSVNSMQLNEQECNTMQLKLLNATFANSPLTMEPDSTIKCNLM